MNYNNGLLTITDFERDLMIMAISLIILYSLYKFMTVGLNINLITNKSNKPKLKFKKNKYKVEIRGLDKLINEYHAEETEDNNYIRLDGILMTQKDFIEFYDIKKELSE